MLVISTVIAGCSFLAPSEEELGSDYGKPSASTGALYVGGPNASDQNPGTATAPFATIQKAASVVVAGNVVRIRSGTYRETVEPLQSGTAEHPIVFEADSAAQVIVSGADPVQGPWSLEHGEIYSCEVELQSEPSEHITSNSTLLANQVFVNGRMLIEARWPNLPDPDDLLDRSLLRRPSATAWTNSTIDDAEIPTIDGSWAGGRIWISGWFLSRTAAITSQTGSLLQFDANVEAPFRNYYYLTGKLGALDAEREWFYDGTKLHVWAPGGGAPQNVEVKKRNYAFDLKGRSFLHVKNIAIFAAAIDTSTYSNGIVLDGLKAQYINHSVTLAGEELQFTHAEETGIRLLGPGSVIRESEVTFSSDQGIVLGPDTEAHDNLVENVAYAGTYASGIAPILGDNHRITYNTIRRTGRSGIDLRGHRNVEIGYNDIHDFGMLTDGGGGIDASQGVDLTGTRIHHNWIHDTGGTGEGDAFETGIALVQGAGPCTIDHNVFWNNRDADLLDKEPAHTSFVYNNTFATSTPASFSYVTHVITPVDVQRNNIYRSEIDLNGGGTTGDIAKALLLDTDPKFVGSGAGGLVYRLSTGSPAIDDGIVIDSITEAFSGSAPDLGAYEFGGVEWIPGHGNAPAP
jgi:hypothetical protein